MFAIRPFGITKILNFKSVQLNWLKKELIPPLKSTIVIDVNQINNCIEYEAEFCWISPKPKNQIKSTITLNMRQSSLGFFPNRGTMSVYRQGSESRCNEIPSKPMQTVLCSQFFQEC